MDLLAAKVQNNTLEAEAYVRDLNRALEGKWPLTPGPRSAWAAALDRVHMIKCDLLAKCVTEVTTALDGRVQALYYGDNSGAAAGWRTAIGAVFALKGTNRNLEQKLAAKIEASTAEVLKEAARICAERAE